MRTCVSRGLATFVVALGLSVMFVPKYVFPICESDHLTFSSSYEPIMRCFWFARAELLLGGLVALSGLVLFVRPTPDSRFAIGVFLVALGLAIVLASMNAFFGSTCGHASSICQIGTKPAERIAGVVVIISSLPLVAFSGKRYKLK